MTPHIAGTPMRALLFAIVLSLGAGQCQAQNREAVERAQKFLSRANTGAYVLSFVHFGANYSNHQFVRTASVSDRRGNAIPGEFALVYDFTWEGGGTGNTTIAFLCKASGQIESVQVLRTNAVLQQPFLTADAATQILGKLLLQAFGEKLTEEQRNEVNALIASANSKGLLEIGLPLRQAIGL